MKTMKMGGQAFLVLGTLLLSGGAAAAQAPRDVAPDAAATALIDPAEVQQRPEQADALLRDGRSDEARVVLAALADEQKVAGMSAAETLLRLASVYHGKNNLTRAAVTLDDAATEAEAHGEPALQARALLEAATIYAGAREFEKAQFRIERLKKLLDSPHLPAELRAEIESRLRG